jgi:glycosyltransferase involved in cell wall biosynthesis
MPETTTQRLHVAMVAPPWFELPPRGYGGIEALCAALADQLVTRGHRVTLIGAGTGTARSRTQFAATFGKPPSGRLGEPVPEVLHAARAARILDRLDVDLVHDHSLAGPLLARGRDVPTLVTTHGPVVGEVGDYYRALDTSVGLVAISNAQRRGAPDVDWFGMVHNAVVVDDFPYQPAKEDYVLFLGRMHPDKGADLAIAAARAAGRHLVLAAKCNEPAERAWFERAIRPLLGPGIDWVGEADGASKRELLARASCLLAPIRWAEPFGLVMTEALACGTPVVALRRGAVTDIVIQGVTGIACERPAELPAAIHQAGGIDPAACRRDARERFDMPVMAAGYERVYHHALGLGTRISPAYPPAVAGAG